MQGDYLFHQKTLILKNPNKTTSQQPNRYQQKNISRFMISNENYDFEFKNKNIEKSLIDLRKSLYKPKGAENHVAQSLFQDWNTFTKQEKLVDQIQNLRDQQLLQLPQVKQIVNFLYQSMGNQNRVKFIYNDYHTKFTNTGYSRNNLGCFYTR